jgi:hypothetical protein
MTTNPLMANKKPAVTRDIYAYAAWLNSLGWVQAAGHHYHVVVRDGPDGPQGVIERRDRLAA